MATIKSFTSLEQSCKLAEILPLESADMHSEAIEIAGDMVFVVVCGLGDKNKSNYGSPVWSLAALLDVLSEINGVSLKIEKLKAKDGYDGYYYPIQYEGIVLIPYSKNPVDACYEMIIKLHELKML